LLNKLNQTAVQCAQLRNLNLILMPVFDDKLIDYDKNNSEKEASNAAFDGGSPNPYSVLAARKLDRYPDWTGGARTCGT
jgi:hypothetical protein